MALCLKKKDVVPLRPIDGAVVPKKHVFTFTSLPATGVTYIYIYIYKLTASMV
jgi:hypothetical protein